MKIFTNKKIWKKIVIILLGVMIFQFLVSNPVKAADGDNNLGIGGKLLEPILDLVVFLGDRSGKSNS